MISSALRRLKRLSLKVAKTSLKILSFWQLNVFCFPLNIMTSRGYTQLSLSIASKNGEQLNMRYSNQVKLKSTYSIYSSLTLFSWHQMILSHFSQKLGKVLNLIQIAKMGQRMGKSTTSFLLSSLFLRKLRCTLLNSAPFSFSILDIRYL